jgi:hypothetical protein
MEDSLFDKPEGEGCPSVDAEVCEDADAISCAKGHKVCPEQRETAR